MKTAFSICLVLVVFAAIGCGTDSPTVQATSRPKPEFDVKPGESNQQALHRIKMQMGSAPTVQPGLPNQPHGIPK